VYVILSETDDVEITSKNAPYRERAVCWEACGKAVWQMDHRGRGERLIP